MITATIRRLAASLSTEITIVIPDELPADTPPPPHIASLGHDWIELASEAGHDTQHILPPESLATALLRAAWWVAHGEQR